MERGGSSRDTASSDTSNLAGSGDARRTGWGKAGSAMGGVMSRTEDSTSL
jgi:hypothetical protein